MYQKVNDLKSWANELYFYFLYHVILFQVPSQKYLEYMSGWVDG